MITTFMFLNETHIAESEQLSEISKKGSRRGHCRKLIEDVKCFYSNRVVDEQNKPSEEMVNAQYAEI